MIFLSQKLQTNTMKHRISRRVKFALSKTEVSPRHSPAPRSDACPQVKLGRWNQYM